MEEKKTNRVGQVFAALGKSLCYLILFVGMQTVVTIALAVGTMSASPAMDQDSFMAAYMTALLDSAMLGTLVSGLLTIAVILAFYLIRRKKLSEKLLLRPLPAPALLTGASLAPALYLVVVTAVSLLPAAWQEGYMESASILDSGTPLVGVVSVAIVAPVVEEFIFRGLIMNRLSRVMPAWLAVVLSAAAFGLCHGQAVWFAYAFVLGLVWAFIALRTGSVWPSILAHLVFNAIGQILSFIPNREEESVSIIITVVLLAVAVAAIILNRKAIAALFRPAPKQAAEEGQNAVPPVL